MALNDNHRKKSSKNTKSSKSAGTGRKVHRRTSSRRRTKKVALDKDKVRLLSGIIFLVCCICIAVNVLLQSENSGRKTKTPAQVEKIEKTEKKSEVSSRNSPQKNEQRPQKSVPQKKKEQTVPALPDKTSAQKAPSKSQTAPQTAPAPAKPVPAENKKNAVTPPPSKETKQNVSPFSIPPAKNGATLVFVIDDAGLNVEYTKKYATLPFPITIAVLPKLAHSKDCAYVVRSNGKELILHQPMQSLNHNLDPGPGKISVDMSFSQIYATVNENLEEIGPGVKGLNNHEGSEVTEDVLRIGAVLDVCAENGIYLLDSRTTANTQAPQAALERDMKIFEKSGPYIDNVVTREAMLAEIYKSLDAANRQGSAIVIAHVDKSAKILPELLLEMYPYMVKAGYRFATPSTLR